MPADILKPAAFPHTVTRLELRETHISWVILTGPFAYKVKKAVRFDFIDASTLARRHLLCAEELRLNCRLSADLYVDVVSITQEGSGPRIGGSGRVLEYAVRMRQFDASQELPALLDHDAVTPQDLVDLGRRLADFHETAPTAPFDPCFPNTEHLHDAVLGTLATLLSHLDGDTALPELGFLIDWTHDYLHDSLPQLRVREREGAIRECHGDLHARNIVKWCGRLLPFDCLEFDPKLRWIDVMNDVAFLVMDLTAHGRKDLAFWFLNAYLERTGGYEGVRHLSFYAVYRALVRAMVDSLAAGANPDHRREYQDRLRLRLKTAASYIRHGAPTLYIMCGLSGSGKSWLSERLAPQLGAVRIRSDLERKRLADVSPRAAPDGGYDQGLYGPDMSSRTYARLLDCARSCLEGGIDVIVDAAFLKAADRQSFHRFASGSGFQFLILECEADPAVLVGRIETRIRQGTDPSDADIEVLARQLSTRESLGTEERPYAVRIDTAQSVDYQSALAQIQDRLSLTP